MPSGNFFKHWQGYDPDNHYGEISTIDKHAENGYYLVKWKNPVPCVASTLTSTYLILALVEGATEYLDVGVTAQEKGGDKGKRARGGVGGRPAGARARGGERTGRDGSGADRP